MKVGIPRSLMFHKLGYLWMKFLENLNIEYIISPNTNKEIMDKGKMLSTDETCIPFKIHMGHIEYLKDKCDVVLVPRFLGNEKESIECIKFNSIYDVVKNTFENINLVEYDIDYTTGNYELFEFISLGKELGKKRFESLRTYRKAKKQYLKYNKERFETQEKILKTSKRKKILLLGHHYNLYDNLIGKPIVKILKKYDIEPIFSDIYTSKEDKSNLISETLYWKSNKEIINSLLYYKNKVDGVIIITAFPCGNDCLVNELIIRKNKDLPMINIVIDELNSETGLITRLESFIDIINERSNEYERNH